MIDTEILQQTAKWGKVEKPCKASSICNEIKKHIKYQIKYVYLYISIVKFIRLAEKCI